MGIPVSEVDEGLSLHQIAGHGVWIDRSGKRFTAFLNDAQHMPGEGVVYCAGQNVFMAPMHGELFDRNGRAIAGPASRGLDRVPASVHVIDEVPRLVVDTSQVTRGEPPVAWEDRHLYLNEDLLRNYDAGGGSGFCTG